MTIILRNATLIDGASDEAQGQKTVRITGSQITGISSDDDDAGPSGATVLDCTGFTVLPGLINMHEHLTFKRTYGPPWRQMGLPPAALATRGIRAAMQDLAMGITTVRELGAPQFINQTLAQLTEAGLVPGPRVIHAGMPLSRTGGHAGSLSLLADGPEEIRKVSRRVLAQGARWIKMIGSDDPIVRRGECTLPEFHQDEFAAAAEVAHRGDARLSVHAMGEVTIREAVEAGADTIEHGVYLTRTLAQRMREQGTALVPTIDSYVETVSPRWGRGEEWARRHQHLIGPYEASTRLAIEEGVRILIGTDSVGHLVQEMARLIELGLPAMEAIKGATSYAAEALGLADRVGTVAVGMEADIVIVRGNPLDDIQNLRRVVHVIRGGQLFDPTDIRLSLDEEHEGWNSLFAF